MKSFVVRKFLLHFSLIAFVRAAYIPPDTSICTMRKDVLDGTTYIKTLCYVAVARNHDGAGSYCESKGMLLYNPDTLVSISLLIKESNAYFGQGNAAKLFVQGINDQGKCAVADNTNGPFELVYKDCTLSMHFFCEFVPEEICTATQQKCLYNHCFDTVEDTCNDKQDCLDGTDETLDFCSTIGIDECLGVDVTFECTNGKCIAGSDECDGEDDCGDNSDEQNCADPSLRLTQFEADFTLMRDKLEQSSDVSRADLIIKMQSSVKLVYETLERFRIDFILGVINRYGSEGRAVAAQINVLIVDAKAALKIEMNTEKVNSWIEVEYRKLGDALTSMYDTLQPFFGSTLASNIGYQDCWMHIIDADFIIGSLVDEVSDFMGGIVAETTGSIEAELGSMKASLDIEFDRIKAFDAGCSSNKTCVVPLIENEVSHLTAYLDNIKSAVTSATDLSGISALTASLMERKAEVVTRVGKRTHLCFRRASA